MRDTPGPHNTAKIALEQGYPSAFNGNVRAGSHRDANIGRSQSRSVIHTVTGHGDDPAFGDQALHDLGLLGRQDFGFNSIDAERPRDRVSRRAVVPCCHDDVQACCAQRAQGGGC